MRTTIAADQAIRSRFTKPGLQRPVLGTRSFMDLKSIRKEGPSAGFTLDESLSVPLGVRLLILLLHQVGLLGCRQVARFDRSYRL